MSTPKSLVIPPGVEKVYAIGGGGDIATLSIEARGARRGHVLLIPGWTGSKEDFTPILPLLADAGYDATTYDQRGQYESDPADDDSLKAFAQDAYLLIEQERSFSHVLGHSFGGLVAQQVAVPAPGEHGEPEPAVHRTRRARRDTGPATPGSARAGAQRQGDPRADPGEAAASTASLAPDHRRFLDTRFTSNAPASLQAMTQLLIDAPDIIDEVAATGLPCWVGRGADDDAWPPRRSGGDGQATRHRRPRRRGLPPTPPQSRIPKGSSTHGFRS